MTEPITGVLVGAPDHRVSLLGTALAPALRELGLNLTVVRCAELGGHTIAEMATALGERLAAGPRPAVLLGDRAGALVVLDLLAAAPGATGCAVLTGARTTPSALELLEAEEIAGRDRAVPARALALLRAACLLSPSRLTDDTVLVDLLHRLRPWPQESAAEAAVLAAAARTRVPAETLAAVTTPCLVLAAALDPVTSPHAARAVAQGLPAATLRTVDCCGAVDAPDAVGAAIGAFVESARTPTPVAP